MCLRPKSNVFVLPPDLHSARGFRRCCEDHELSFKELQCCFMWK